MQQVDDGRWVVKCRACPKRRMPKPFATARECHDWWREHEATELHAERTSPEHRAQRVKQRQEIDAVLSLIFPTSQ